MDHAWIEELIRTFGYIGLFIIVFAETGLLFGFFLPGDSLLITAGILSSQGFLNIIVLCLVLFVAAVLGDSVGYAIGKWYGKRLYSKEDSRFFRKEHLVHATNFYEKHGGKTIILARFIPIVRTFAPTVAGIAAMPYSKFITYNVAGALLWAVGLTLGGYFLGRAVKDIDAYLIPIILLIIVVSVGPGMYEVLKVPENRKRIYHHTKKFLSRKK